MSCRIDYTAFAVSGKVERFNHTSGVTVVTPTDRRKSVRNRCVIGVLVAFFFVLSRCFLDFSVGVGAFVIELSQISSFFSFKSSKLKIKQKIKSTFDTLYIQLPDKNLNVMS